VALAEVGMAASEGLLSVAGAQEAVRREAVRRPARSVPLAEATGCTLAEGVAADRDSPPFDKALVDGYAVRAADLEGENRTLRLGEIIVAGKLATRPVGPGEAAGIMTGAPLPDEADAVVMFEDTEVVGDRVTLRGKPPRPGQNVLHRGREMRAGEVVLEAGTVLNAPAIGLLASVGRVRPVVVPRPRVAVVPTGDELVEPGQVPGPGQIRNSNAALLRALAVECGADVTVHPIARDEPGPLRAILAAALAHADVLLVTGGVSVGTRDLVPPTLAELGLRTVFHKVRLKPGKPLLFGVGTGEGPNPGPLVFGLPGNPVSGLVGFLLFVRPALACLAGRAWAGPMRGPYPLATRFRHRGDRPTYHPARLVAGDAGPALEPLDWAGSPDLRTVARADGFAHFPPGDREHLPGDPLEFLPLA
jgi:molybdopterin molybdotransferase